MRMHEWKLQDFVVGMLCNYVPTISTSLLAGGGSSTLWGAIPCTKGDVKYMSNILHIYTTWNNVPMSNSMFNFAVIAVISLEDVWSLNGMYESKRRNWTWHI